MTWEYLDSRLRGNDRSMLHAADCAQRNSPRQQLVGWLEPLRNPSSIGGDEMGFARAQPILQILCFSWASDYIAHRPSLTAAAAPSSQAQARPPDRPGLPACAGNRGTDGLSWR